MQAVRLGPAQDEKCLCQCQSTHNVSTVVSVSLSGGGGLLCKLCPTLVSHDAFYGSCMNNVSSL